MSDIAVTVTNAGATGVSVVNGDAFNAVVGDGGSVNVSIGEVTPGNGTIVSGTLTINSVVTLPAGSSAYVKNDAGTAYAAKLDIGLPAGPATSINIGNTTTLSPGSNATVSGVANGSNLTLSFGIPRGASGINGVTPSFSIGNVTTGAAGSSASVTATSTNNGANVTLDLTIPRGNQGVDGTNGTNGTSGVNGVTPSFAIGNVTTGAAGSSASVTATTTNGGANVTLDLTIPRGDQGINGTNGTDGTSLMLSDATPSDLGTASAGVSNLASRSDHTHSLPIISYANLSGVPENFPTNTTLVSGLSAGYAAINHSHNYVQSFNNLTGNLTLVAGSNVTLVANGSTLTLSSTGGLGANDSIDGGDYVGEIFNGITITSQPVSASSATAVVSWSSQASPSNLTVSGLSYANGAFFALGAGKVATSSNLSSWTSANLPQNFVASEISYGNGAYVAVGKSPSTGSIPFPVAKSTDGTSWSSGSGDTSSYYDFSSIAYGNGLFVAMLTYQGNASYIVNYFTSADGSSWTMRSMPYSSGSAVRVREVAGIAYGNGVFVATVNSVNLDTRANVNTQYLTSTDGLTWTIRDLPAACWSGSVAFGNGVFVLLPLAVGVTYPETVSTLYTSTNGVTWTARALPLANYWSRVRWCGGAFVATRGEFGVGTGTGTDVIWSSTGASWTLGSLPSSGDWFYAAGGGDTALVASASKMAKATVAAGSVSFSTAATIASGATLTYQWQVSTDTGSTWSNISSATSSTLSLSGLTITDSGKRYRCAISATGSATAYTQSAILTVT